MRPFTLRRVLALVVVMLLGAGGLPAAAQSPRPAERPPGAWVHLGPTGFDVGAFAVSPDWATDPFVIAFGHDAQSRRSIREHSTVIEAEIVRSFDGGQTWDRLGPAPRDVGSLRVGPTGTTGRVLFMLGIGDTHGTGLGISRSTDEGASWVRVLSVPGRDFPTLPPERLVLSPSFGTDGVAFALHNGTVYRSRDFGATWTRVAPSGDQRTHQILFSPAFASDNTVVAAVVTGRFPHPWTDEGDPGRLTNHETSAGVMISKDGGGTWSDVANGLMVHDVPYRYVQQIALSPSFGEDGTMFAFGWGPWTSSHVPAVLFRSTDRGSSWSPTMEISGGRDQQRYHATLALSPSFADDGVGLVGVASTSSWNASPHSRIGCEVSRSADHGQSWNFMPQTERTPGCFGMAMGTAAAMGRVAYGVTPPSGGNAGTLYRSLDDASTWGWIRPPGYTDQNGPWPPVFTAGARVIIGTRDGVWMLNPNPLPSALPGIDVPGAPR